MVINMVPNMIRIGGFENMEVIWSMKMRLFLNQKRTKEKGERQRDKLPFFFVENFFGSASLV